MFLAPWWSRQRDIRDGDVSAVLDPANMSCESSLHGVPGMNELLLSTYLNEEAISQRSQWRNSSLTLIGRNERSSPKPASLSSQRHTAR